MTAPARRLPGPVAAVVWAIVLGMPAGIVLLVLATSPPDEGAWAFPMYSLIVATWSVAGAFLVTRRPGNLVGWVMLAVGVGVGAAMLGQLWAFLSVLRHGGTLPGTAAAATLALVFFPSVQLVILVPLLFPDGRVMSRRWGAAAVLLLASAGITFVGSLVRAGELEGMPGFANPLGLPALGDLPQALVDLGGMGTLVCLAIGMLAAVVRYRRGDPVERKQLKWFGSVLLLALSMFLLAATIPQPYGQWAWIVASLSTGLIPVAIGIAILRYRLYEIDRLVSRTLSYAIITGVLALAFVATNLAFQALVANATGANTIAVAASTLVVAALFQPLRRRVQSSVDRRFNRARVDAQDAIEAFGFRVRDEMDLGDLQARLLATTTASVHPAGASVWIRR